MWRDVPGWNEDALAEAWSAFLSSCVALSKKPVWRDACSGSARIGAVRPDLVRAFFERTFSPWQVTEASGSEYGLVTGYYEPILRGSRNRTDRYRYAVYGVPDDLLVIELDTIRPELKTARLRGRLEGRRVVPYYDRAQIESGDARVRGTELVWLDDPIELFFLHVQGSGRILLDTGETMRVGYAEHNGYPYRSIGKVLIERGAIAPDRASMQDIKAWARTHPAELSNVLNANRRYVFFRELPATSSGPVGALGVPLTAGRSIAIDPAHVPLGAPVFVETTWPLSSRPLNRLMLAQDTGNAIRGPVRADLFWGSGGNAAREAGRMKQRLRMWVLLPRGYGPGDFVND